MQNVGNTGKLQAKIMAVMRGIIMSLSFLILILETATGQQHIQLAAHVPYAPVQLANIGGYVDTAGREYALVGTTAGLSIVEVTVPTTPVTLFNVSGVTSVWREVKTWQHYAYVTNENGDGLQIIDLAYLPDSVHVRQWHGDDSIAGNLITAHALHIDNGYLYLYGCGNGVSKLFHGAAVICDLNADPWNPHYLGHTTDFGSSVVAYIHDGYVANDTLWAAHIYAGVFRVWDCTVKSAPVLLATRSTTTQFTHNTWLSDNHQTLFTTDENSGSFLTAYDVSDVNNIDEISRFQTAPGSNATVHNTHILNDYAVTSWYTEGVVITDVSRPGNPIEVGKYDTYPGSGLGTVGCWGAYPFLPSGTLLASDMQNGLYVLTPTYIRGCYLEGTVTDSLTGLPLMGASVTLLPAGISKTTSLTGTYKTGTADSGMYDVTVSAAGYVSKTITGVVLQNGVLTLLDVSLSAVASSLEPVPSGVTCGLAAYPNPAAGMFSVRYRLADAGGGRLEITDASGRLMDAMSIPAGDGRMEAGGYYPPGVYFLRLRDNRGHQEAIRLVKSR
jgi:choice-of-anchor B domain-containing protein